ncbi:MAG: peroxidase family protein [Mycolicibacterium sp.]|uniref:peroxidase family protein n=1 Tax=Mycolicibacterium sp. TaxID=2320850 RepID=UPI003D0CD197
MWAMLAWARRRAAEPAPSMFGRMFPVVTTSDTTALLPLNQQSDQELAGLAQTMLEVQTIANPKGTSAGLTYFGQFIDHDLTLDSAPSPTGTVDVESLVNGRTFAFDLDSVYGGGPKTSPQLYDGDKFLIGTASDGVSPDLPRNADGSAILVEARNDENLLIAQIHLSFLRLHNALVDEGMSFDRAQQTVVDAYRHVVLNDYLPQIVGQEAVDQALSQQVSAGFYQPGSKDSPVTPVEFSAAVFRFGHSQVGNAYAINDASGFVRVFSLDPTVSDLRGGRQLPSDLIIDFNNFFSELPRDEGEAPALLGRAIDTKISPSLFELPIPGVAGGGSNVLAFRNLVRGKFYDLPSGEAIAEAMGLPAIGEPVFAEGTPLWYYVLREAELTSGGAEFGPVGGSIVAEVFVDLLRLDGGTKESGLPDVSGGDFRIGDLLVAADQLGGDDSGAHTPKPGRGDEARPTRDHARERSERHPRHRHNHSVDNAATEPSLQLFVLPTAS